MAADLPLPFCPLTRLFDTQCACTLPFNVASLTLTRYLCKTVTEKGKRRAWRAGGGARNSRLASLYNGNFSKESENF